MYDAAEVTRQASVLSMSAFQQAVLGALAEGRNTRRHRQGGKE
jgi:hypothetical protein